MSCYHSKPAWRKSYGISLKYQEGSPDYFIPCGKCLGCKAQRSREWGIRIVHESKSWDRNSFITLTYDDDHLPEDGKIRKDDVQSFIKKLRKFQPEHRPIRYFACGEYGDKTKRPHYHAIIFNEDFRSSRYTYTINDSMYGNKELENLWGQGQVSISDLNENRAFYTAGYVTKKINDQDTFALMSYRPPLGKEWLRKNYDNVRRNKNIVIQGKEYPIPTKYFEWLRGVEEIDKIKAELQEEIKPLNDQKLRAKRANYIAKQNLRNQTI